MDVSVIQIVMPQMGESLTEGTIVKWLKLPGDPVAVDEPLCEIATDKANTELPSPRAGVLRAILVPEGKSVGVGEPLAVIEGAESPTPVAGDAATQSPVSAEVSAALLADGHFRHAEDTPVLDVTARRTPAPAAPTGDPAPSFSPAVLSVVREGGVPLAALTTLRGSGRHGRVTKRDVQRFLAGQAAGTVASPAPAPLAPPSLVAAPSRLAHGWAVPDEYRYKPKPEDRVVPLSPGRRRIARATTWTMRVSPHTTSSTECDMSEVAARLQRAREGVAERVGAPLTYTALVAFALVRVLEEFPALNASIVDEALVMKPYVHLGIAVALEETDELVVPVVHNAHELSLEGLARAIDELAVRARGGRLKQADMADGTFTFTNPGMFGGTMGAPLIVQPQVGILAMTSIRKRVVAIGDAIAIRPMTTLCLGHDHRAIDGMMAFRFVEAVRRRLEQPAEANA